MLSCGATDRAYYLVLLWTTSSGEKFASFGPQQKFRIMFLSQLNISNFIRRYAQDSGPGLRRPKQGTMRGLTNRGGCWVAANFTGCVGWCEARCEICRSPTPSLLLGFCNDHPMQVWPFFRPRSGWGNWGPNLNVVGKMDRPGNAA